MCYTTICVHVHTAVLLALPVHMFAFVFASVSWLRQYSTLIHVLFIVPNLNFAFNFSSSSFFFLFSRLLPLIRTFFAFHSSTENHIPSKPDHFVQLPLLLLILFIQNLLITFFYQIVIMFH